MEIKILHRNPTVTEFQKLRSSTGWDKLDDQQVDIALSNSLFSVCAEIGDSVVAMGRVVGDGGVYFYLQDIMVLPEYQAQKIGVRIMREIEQWLNEHAPKHAFIGLMAAQDTQGFYSKHGYQVREVRAPGMFKVV